ncbi:MAG: hypothetical protein R2728_05110 [Chitinophagales bacterium]
MELDKNRYLVNWTDGMKIKKDHFIQSENYYNKQIQSIRYQYKRNNEFGILPSDDGYTSLQMQLSHDDLVVNKCLAVTGDGSFILIENNQPLRLDAAKINELMNALNNNRAGVYIVIQVNTTERVPIGEPDPDEVPLRKPYATVRYVLDVMPESQINKDLLSTANFAVIGKIISDGAIIRIDDEFIAPCTHVMNNEILSDYYDRWMVALERTNKNAIMVVNKVLSKNQRLVLDRSIMLLSQNMMTHISSKIDYLKHCKKSISPIELLSFGFGYTRVIRNSIESIFKNEELINYICQYIKADPSLFKKFIEHDVLGMSYNVLDLNKNFRRMDKLIESFDHIYVTLPSLSYKVEGDHGLIVE